MEVRMKQRCVTEFLHAGKVARSDIYRRLLNVYGDQTVNVSTVRRWVVRFSSGDSDVKDKPRSGRPSTAVTPRNYKLYLLYSGVIEGKIKGTVRGGRSNKQLLDGLSKEKGTGNLKKNYISRRGQLASERTMLLSSDRPRNDCETM
jgi:hypothetical protein